LRKRKNRMATIRIRPPTPPTTPPTIAPVWFPLLEELPEPEPEVETGEGEVTTDPSGLVFVT